MPVGNFIGQLTGIQKSYVTMGVWRVIVVCGCVICFESLLQGLMAEEGGVQPVTASEESFCGTDVFAHLFEPRLYKVLSVHFCYVFACKGTEKK